MSKTANPTAARALEDFNMGIWWVLEDVKHPLAEMLNESGDKAKLVMTPAQILVAIYIFSDSSAAFGKLQESRASFDAAAFAFAAGVSVEEMPLLVQKLQKVIADIPAHLAPSSKPAKQSKPAKE